MPVDAVMGVPISAPPIGLPLRRGTPHSSYGPYSSHGYQRVPQGLGGRYIGDDLDDDEFDDVQAKCAQICCASTCPCCIGDPLTPEWRNKVYEAWCHTFIGLMSILMVLVFVACTIYGLSHGGVDTNLRLDKRLLHLFGSKSAADIVSRLELWRLLSCLLLHASGIHLLWNLFVQMTLGWMLETGIGIVDATEMLVRAPWGAQRTALLYVTAGITGGLLGCVCAPTTQSVGASAALMGLVGARIAGLMVMWPRLPVALRMVEGLQYAFWTIFIFCFGLGNDTVDNWGHLGGMVAGILMGGYVFIKEEQGDCDSSELSIMQRAIPVMCLLMLVLFNAALVTALVTVTQAALVSKT